MAEAVVMPQQVADLLQAFSTISSDLGTRALLERIVTAARELTGAKYGALAVLDDTQDAPDALRDFVTVGLSVDEIAAIGELPRGRGLLNPATHTDESLLLEDLATHPASAGFPPHHPPMRTLLMVPVRVRGEEFGNLYLTDKQSADGEVAAFTESDRAQVTALASMTGFILDNSRATRVSERRRRWLEMFSYVAGVLQPPIALSEALQRVTSAVQIASGAVAAAIVQIEEDGSAVTTASTGPITSHDLEDPHFAALVRDVNAHRDVREASIGQTRVALVAPLRGHLTLPGVLVIVHDVESRPDYVEERDLLAAFADHVAVTLDRTQALEDRQAMAIVEDRDRIARDLHDVVIQRLFATGLAMQGVRNGVKELPGVRDRVDAVVRDLDQTIRDIRGTIFDLTNDVRSSLRTEIATVVREFIPSLGFAPSVHLRGQVDISIDAQVHQRLCAVLREALSNVAQHAQAASAVVEVEVGPDDVRLLVTDSGRGLPTDGDLTLKGLRNVRRWAALLGGTATWSPHQPTGTVLEWRVPLPTS